MPKGKKRGFIKGLNIGEDLRIAVNLRLQHFRNAPDEKEYEFPSSFTADERCYVHRLALEMGLKSKSRGSGSSRYLTVYKREGSTIMQTDASFKLSPPSKEMAQILLNNFPLNFKERQELLPPTDRDRNATNMAERDFSRSIGKLGNGLAQIPSSGMAYNSNAFATRTNLPIWSYRDQILESINTKQVTIISGETGSGKTTQVPQFILENAFEFRTPCRIICTQPRRLAAVSVAERVASERDETIGGTVGFQIRLESRYSPMTLLTFCTTGILLRTLMGGDGALAGITHIIIDEIHERDRFSDFLITVLRDLLNKYRNLKLILMSATLDLQLFINYFSGANHISIPGRMFDVQELYLEDILIKTNYNNLASESAMHPQKNRKDLLTDLTKDLSNETKTLCEQDQSKSANSEASDCQQEFEPLSTETINNLDSNIASAFSQENEEILNHLIDLIVDNKCPINYAHSHTGVTVLMIAAAHGNIKAIELLLELGADVDIKANNDWKAKDFAIVQDHKEAKEILETYRHCLEPIAFDDAESITEELNTSQEMTEEKLNIIQKYQSLFDDEKVDYDLIYTLIEFILNNYQDKDGAIIVFVPGYDDICTLMEKLSDLPNVMALPLHSQLSSNEQRKVFKPAMTGTKKIILSTNIAETSLTIDDVEIVIDSGKVKEKSYDSLTNVSMLKMVWISQNSAQQRKGRAGRCKEGIVFRLFSKPRFEHFTEFQTPEILRTPLMELCLHTKLLAPVNTHIGDFLSRTPQPPSTMAIRNAVQMLKTMEALDAWEDVTELGTHLLDLPVEPRFGKMILYALVLKCLDPILTIVSCCAYRDPFILSPDPVQKRKSQLSRINFSAQTFSDHMIFLRVFQAWETAKFEGQLKSFCRKNCISSATMEMISGMRTQLIGHLRASGFVRLKGNGDIKDLNKNSEHWPVVKAALTAGSYPNLARFDREAQQLRSQKETKLRLHPSCSFLNSNTKKDRFTSAETNCKTVESVPTDWFIFDEMLRVGHLAMIRGCTAVSPLTVLLFAGPNKLPTECVNKTDTGIQANPYLEENSDSEVEEKEEGETSVFKIDDWTIFRSEADVAFMALQLRQKWSSFFLRRIQSPHKLPSQMDNAVLDTIVNILQIEENILGLTQPSGISQKPRNLSSDQQVFGERSQGSYSPSFNNQIGMQRRGAPGGNYRGRNMSGPNRPMMGPPMNHPQFFPGNYYGGR